MSSADRKVLFTFGGGASLSILRQFFKNCKWRKTIIVYIICKTERPHFLIVCVTTQKWIQDQNIVSFSWTSWEMERRSNNFDRLVKLDLCEYEV